MGIVSYKISRRIKLPYSVVKGSVSSRTNKAEVATEKLYQQIMSITDGNSCSVEDFKTCVKKFLAPNKVNINVKDNPYKYADAAISIASTFNKVGSKGEYKYHNFTFYFPLNSNNDRITNSTSIRHELRHFFDHLYHPKTVASSTIYNKINIYDLSLVGLKYTNKPLGLKSIASNIYHKFANIRIFDYISKRSIKKELNQLPKEYIIPLLQDIRYAIISEINAYNESKKAYINKSLLNIRSVITLNTLSYLQQRYSIKKALVEELLKEYIAKERAKNRIVCN